ncbi:MAG TPA: sigma-70 family RNA polymerase sigma factor, partial [Tepidisphaeraceae bacterium]
DADESREDISPLLDEGIARLRKADRDAILLKFFEQKSHREIAGMMGISEAAAAKRVSRAVERLHDFYARHGVTLTSAGLETTLAVEASRLAPHGLATSAANVSSASSSAAAVAKGAMILMTTAKIKTAVIAAIFVLIVFAGGIVAVESWNENSSAVEVAPQSSVVVTSPAAPSAWQAQFGDAKISQAGITDATIPNAPWWRADGAPTAAPTLPPTGPMSQRIITANPGQRVRFVFLAQGLSVFSMGMRGNAGSFPDDDISITLLNAPSSSSYVNLGTNPPVINLTVQPMDQQTRAVAENRPL